MRPAIALQDRVLPFAPDVSGPTFKSVAMILKLRESLRLGEPLSVTMTVTGLVTVPAGPEGTQANKPFVGLSVAPAGALLPRLNVNCCTGMSVSVAVILMVMSLPLRASKSAIGFRCGGVLVARESGLAGSEPKSISSRSR